MNSSLLSLQKWDASTKPDLKAHHLRPQDWDDNPPITYKKTLTMDPLTNTPGCV